MHRQEAPLQQTAPALPGPAPRAPAGFPRANLDCGCSTAPSPPAAADPESSAPRSAELPVPSSGSVIRVAAQWVDPPRGSTKSAPPLPPAPALAAPCSCELPSLDLQKCVTCRSHSNLHVT